MLTAGNIASRMSIFAVCMQSHIFRTKIQTSYLLLCHALIPVSILCFHLYLQLCEAQRHTTVHKKQFVDMSALTHSVLLFSLTLGKWKCGGTALYRYQDKCNESSLLGQIALVTGLIESVSGSQYRYIHHCKQQDGNQYALSASMDTL